MTTIAEPQLANPFDVMHLGWSFMRSRVVMAALDLGVFTALEEGPKSCEQLEADLGLHSRGARDFLDALASLGLLARDGCTYRNSAAASTYLVSTSPNFLGGFLTLTTNFMGLTWNTLADLLRTGNAGRENGNGDSDGKGGSPFAQVFRDPEKLRSFLAAMDSLNGLIGPALVSVIPLDGIETFVDLGGARGNLAGNLVLWHQQLKGMVLDRPVMKRFFDERMADLGTTDKVEFIGGDFFHDDLPAVDMAIVGNVLHDFSEEKRVALIGRAYEALPAGGVLVVYDPMIDDDRRDTDKLLMSLSMMLQSDGGSEYTPADCRSYVEQAGFEVVGVYPLPASATAVVGRKLRV